MYMAAALEATAWSRIDWPPIRNQLRTPGIFLRMALTFSTTARVLVCDAASGSWMPTIA
jgi:hypothetical protein